MPAEPARSRPSELVEHYFRHEYGRLVSTLSRRFGFQRISLVEDAVQSALLTALTAWALKGLPDDPSGWLYRVARNQLIDAMRRESAGQRAHEREQTLAPLTVPGADDPRFDSELPDDQLRMLFVCCHEGIPPESQLVLALKTLCGFSTSEIALRLFTSEDNVHKRLSRARERLRELAPDLAVPAPLTALQSRIDGVHRVLYLLFNEGYHSSHADQLVRRELCEEAIRLCTLLVQHAVGDTAATRALLAMMYLHSARLAGRVDSAGQLLLLAEQDRSQWDKGLAQEGARWLGLACQGDEFSRYHAEAAIAAEHCFAPSFEQTRWHEIVDLYAMLEKLAPSPLFTLNRAIACAEADGPRAGLALLESVRPPSWLAGFYLWDATFGELHMRNGEPARAREYLVRALEAAPTEAERTLLRRRLAACIEAADAR
jgi:RNA polymerase sigma factor (sigma-70 family)